jgi:putative two-component system response regulator
MHRQLEVAVSNGTHYCPTILIADDNHETREILTQFIRSQGVRVICASDGEEALETLREMPVDLALLDVMMPRRTGIEVCREIKATPQTQLIPIVLIIGLGNVEDRVRGIESGADDFHCMPVHKEELLARVRSLLRVKRYTEELESAEEVICSLARCIEAKDPYTVGHCDRLSLYAVALGEHRGLSTELCVALRRAGIVHDIGKVGVPEHILSKPGPLTLDERQVMAAHPVAGEHICSPLRAFHLVLPIIRYHHEHLDGTGYPDHLHGDEIPLTARILQTVDVYDALTTDRPYRKALSDDEAFRIMRLEAKRGWWDARLVEEFVAIVETGRIREAGRLSVYERAD